jgi:hypothetical protein
VTQWWIVLDPSLYVHKSLLLLLEWTTCLLDILDHRVDDLMHWQGVLYLVALLLVLSGFIDANQNLNDLLVGDIGLIFIFISQTQQRFLQPHI